MLPLVLLFFGWNAINESLTIKNVQLNTLTKELGELKIQKELGDRATQRYAGYRQLSLPSNVESSITQYQLWLQELAEKVGIQDFSVEVKNRGAPDAIAGADPRNPVFNLYRFELTRGVCNIRQLTELIFRLNQSLILHRIKDISITPSITGTGPRAEPTGELVLRMTLEVACLRDAEPTRAFEEEVTQDSRRPLEDYHHIVSRRDLFGPPNSKPELGASSTHKVVWGRNVMIDLEGDDADKGQQLTYEISDLEWELDDDEASFDPASITLQDGEVEMGRLPKGSYRFTARITDNGWPSKSDEKNIEVEVFEEEQEEEPPQRPEAKDTRITGKTTRDRVIPQVWIRIMPRDTSLMLIEGESFQLDSKTWTIDRIADDAVYIDCDGQKLKYRYGSMLSNPEETETATSNAASGQGR